MQPHSVKFGDKDSWGDFGLLLLSREIEYPTPKTKMVDVPGSNSYIDLTEAVSSEVKYKNRKLSFKFMLYSYQRILTPVPMPFWQEIIDNIAGFLHGKRLEIHPSWDECYYEGRCTINEYRTDRKTATIVIDCDCSPYKIKHNYLNNAWIWDTFSFIDGVIYTNGYTVNGSSVITLQSNHSISGLHISCSKDMTLVYENETYTLKKGDNQIPEIKLHGGTNSLQFTCSGEGVVSFSYKEGVL